MIVCDKCGKRLSVMPFPYGWRVDRNGVEIKHWCDDCSGIPFPPDWPYKESKSERKKQAKAREEKADAGVQGGLFDSTTSKGGASKAKR